MEVTVGARQSRAANGTGPGLTTAHVACRVAPVRGSGVSHGGGANACAIPFAARDSPRQSTAFHSRGGTHRRPPGELGLVVGGGPLARRPPSVRESPLYSRGGSRPPSGSPSAGWDSSTGGPPLAVHLRGGTRRPAAPLSPCTACRPSGAAETENGPGVKARGLRSASQAPESSAPGMEAEVGDRGRAGNGPRECVRSPGGPCRRRPAAGAGGPGGARQSPGVPPANGREAEVGDSRAGNGGRLTWRPLSLRRSRSTAAGLASHLRRSRTRAASFGRELKRGGYALRQSRSPAPGMEEEEFPRLFGSGFPGKLFADRGGGVPHREWRAGVGRTWARGGLRRAATPAAVNPLGAALAATPRKRRANPGAGAATC